jgi:hypothetical protein
VRKNDKKLEEINGEGCKKLKLKTARKLQNVKVRMYNMKVL